jgi:hypothetical protein
MNKLLILGILGILLIGFVSSYVCVYQHDSPEVQNFKMRINNIALEQDFENGLTEEGLRIKLKYFSPCNFG